MIRNSMMAFIVILLLMLPIAFLGCHWGGDYEEPTPSPSPSPSPSIQVLPSSYNFGTVTQGNSPAPLEVEISNEGSAVLNVSDIELTDTNNYALDLNGGSNPCNSAAPTIATGDNCTGEIDFLPQSTASFNANLGITSNDPDTPTVNVPLSGSQEEITELNVRINQVETNCPGTVFTAYVSVTDQGGYPVTTLIKDDFLVTEDGVNLGAPTTDSFVSNIATISVALLMDYSGSITSIQDAVDDMEESAASFIDQLSTNDEAEIIKFADGVDVVQSWQPGTVAGKDLLEGAIYAPYDNGNGETDLYDAVVKAVDDIVAFSSKDRKAVIVITDGKNDAFLSDNPDLYADVIDHAKDNGVPIFAVGLGNVNLSILQDMANLTGGQLHEATSSDNLRTVYQQLADVLFHDQYILTYFSGLGAGTTGNLTIKATLPALPLNPGEDTREITACP